MTTNHPATDPRLGRVSVGEAMHPDLISCLPEATLSTMAATLVTHGIHALLVSAPHPGPPRVVTDLDVVAAATEQGHAITAQDLAREPIALVPADATLDDAVQIMDAHYVTHLLATDPVSGAPAGMLSSLDVAAVAGGGMPRLARTKRIAPARPSPSATALSTAIVGDVMHPGIVTCAPDAPLASVARTMADHRVHCVAIAGIRRGEGAAQHLTWGLVADIDLMAALRRAAIGAPAELFAETQPLAVQPSEPLDRAAALMVEHGAAHLVVVSPTGLPSGIVSTLDVALILAAAE
jgi:CBS domain-containing protein